MGVLQYEENESGIIVEYWKVSGISLSFSGKRGFITMTGYYTEATRTSDKDQVGIKQVKVEPHLFDDYFSENALSESNTKIQCYKYVIDNDKFFKDSLTSSDITVIPKEVIPKKVRTPKTKNTTVPSLNIKS